MAKLRKRNPVSEAEDEESIIVLKYLRTQNRPYNLNDIFNNLGGKISKTSITKVLTQLAKDGLIKEKVYGKQLIYAAAQNSVSSLSKEEIEKYKNRISEVREEVADLQKKHKNLQSEFTVAANIPTEAELDKKLRDIKESNLKLQSKIELLANTSIKMTTEKEQSDANAQLELLKHQWKINRAIFKDIRDTIFESMETNPKDLLIKLGIEDDNDAGVDISTFSNFTS